MVVKPASSQQLEFEAIASAHGAMISRIAASYEADRNLCEDLIQDIFIAVWRALPAFRGESSAKTFVARIAQKRSVTHVARRVRQPKLVELDVELPGAGPTPEEGANQARERDRLTVAARQLSLPQREVILLTLEGFNQKEISEILDLAPNAVALRFARAKQSLKQLLGLGNG